MTPTIIIIAVFLGVTALVGGVALLWRNPADSAFEDRLDVLTGASSPKGAIADDAAAALTRRPLDDVPSAIEDFFSKFFNVRLLLDQANLQLSPAKFFLISGGLASVGAVIIPIVGMPIWAAPISGFFLSTMPLIYVWFKRRSRLKAFGKQLPEALELVARALRAGHSLGAGLQLVQSEMKEPIGTEFGRVYEEQNLGIAMEDALENLADRVPNLDLRFFATAVILQRQTGGDLAEILDKIGHLIRERFKIWGQIQALTGEGRLSGIVLLILPPALFAVMFKLNPSYTMILFEDPMGQQMLAVAIVMQIVGALVIKKIVNIKV